MEYAFKPKQNISVSKHLDRRFWRNRAMDELLRSESNVASAILQYAIATRRTNRPVVNDPRIYCYRFVRIGFICSCINAFRTQRRQ